ncbi:MAG: hypothetical protein KAS59_10005 [Alphaproteobacteria bacterium]|nr:hypothetical protein [Alphaproteobacteria bacterium]
MTRQRFYLFAIFMAFASCIFLTSFAQAQTVSLDPKRIVFTGRDRTKEIFLMNSGDKEAVYRVFFQEMKMDKDGGVKVIKKEDVPEGYSAASTMIRYSPRQVTIPAHGSQVVMFMARKKKTTADGEYRSHAVFQAVPQDAGETLDDIVLKEGEIGVKITPIFGISIPVIIRQGDLSATAEISGLKIEDGKEGKKILNLTLHRKGNRSLYGSFTANYTPPGSKKEVAVGYIKGVAVYDGLAARTLKIALNPPEGTSLKKGGKIVLKFEEDRDMGGDAKAEASIVIK